MATFFRRYFWLMTGAFILLASLLVASTANLFVELGLAPPIPDSTAEVKRSLAAYEEARAKLDGAMLARLTGLNYETPPPPSGPGPGDDDDTLRMRSSLRVKLLGTLLAHDSQWSLASVEDLEARRARSVMAGDELLGARVVAIERERIILSVNGREEYIDSGDQPAVPPPALTRAAPAAGSNLGQGIRAVGENAYEIPSADLNDALSRMNELAMQARIVPSFRNGQPTGFKVFSVRQGSFYEKLGIQNGDVIQRINGFDMNSPEKALEVYAKLREARRVELELERAGAVVRKVYDIK